jgi:hypothetical protein
VDEELEEKFPNKPCMSFGIRDVEIVWVSCVYWKFTTKALEDMLGYAGFAESTPETVPVASAWAFGHGGCGIPDAT